MYAAQQSAHAEVQARTLHKVQVSVSACMEVSPWAEVFAAIASPVLDSLEWDVVVIPYMAMPHPRTVDRLHRQFPGADISFWNRYGAPDMTDEPTEDMTDKPL